MSMPTILPTGAMASGDYVDYMISYNNAAADSLATQIEEYIPQHIIEDWNKQWLRTISDINVKITALNSDISSIKSDIILIENIL